MTGSSSWSTPARCPFPGCRFTMQLPADYAVLLSALPADRAAARRLAEVERPFVDHLAEHPPAELLAELVKAANRPAGDVVMTPRPISTVEPRGDLL